MLAALLTLQIHAAASLTDVLREVGDAFTRATHISVAFNFAGSSTIARQIESGAPGDVFISADEAQMDRVKPFIVRGTRRDILSNQLAIVGERDLLKAKRIALADPRAVPAGVYAREYLERKGLWRAIEKKVIPTENVRAALAAVKAGNADSAIVYRTDDPHGFVITDGPTITYPAAVIRDSKEARRFVEFLSSDEAKKIFRKYGFVPK